MKKIITLAALLAVPTTLQAATQSVDLYFELVSPIAFSNPVAGDLGVLDVAITNTTDSITYDTDGTMSGDTSHYLSGAVIVPSVDIQGTSTSTIIVWPEDGTAGLGNLALSNFLCSTDGAAEASCADEGTGYTVTASGSPQTLTFGYTVTGTSTPGTEGAYTAALTINAVYQ